MSRKNKTWKDIEDSRNRRLWVTQVGIPITGMLVTLYACVPGFREKVNDIPYQVKRKWAHLKNRFPKKK